MQPPRPIFKLSKTSPPGDPPSLHITYESLDGLLTRRSPRNPKAHDHGAIRSSFDRFGFVSPVLINDTDDSLAEGHGRATSLAEMRSEGLAPPTGVRIGSRGEWLVPTVHVRLAPGQADAYRVAANRTSELGGWDDRLLAEVLQSLTASDSGLSGIGFTATEVDALVASARQERQPMFDPEEIPPPVSLPEVRLHPGDLVRMGPHQLLVGDATRPADVRRAVGVQQVSCLWTDAPYGLSYTGGSKPRTPIANDDPAGLRQLLAGTFAAVDTVLAPGAPLYVCHAAGPLAMVATDEFCRVGWSFRQSLVWVKNSFVPGGMDYMYRHESILYGFKPRPGSGRLGRGGRSWYGGNDAQSVFEIPRPSASPDHPTAKPVRLVEAMLRNSTRAGDLVLDPFTGSGPTLIACELLGRRFAGLEIEPRYAQITVDRWERYTGQSATVEPAR